MTADNEFSKHDFQRSLELAAGYLDGELEAITNDVWDVQQRLRDLRAELEQVEG